MEEGSLQVLREHLDHSYLLMLFYYVCEDDCILRPILQQASSRPGTELEEPIRRRVGFGTETKRLPP